MSDKNQKILLYSTPTSDVKIEVLIKDETIWLTQDRLSILFDIQRPAITKHLKNIFESRELTEKSVSSILEHTANDGKKYRVKYYNLDAIISVGYRVNSKKATTFRQWATTTLRQHILKGYTVNKNQISQNYEVFMNAVKDIKRLLPEGDQIGANDALELVKLYASTWLSLSAYDKSDLPTKGATKKIVNITADQLQNALQDLRSNSIVENPGNDMFGIENRSGNIAGIVGNIFQSFDGKDLYPSPEVKAAHLLYFMVKNHPFVDGNKRSGAFAFVWFLRRANMLDISVLSPEALTALTLLVAESKPIDKDKIIGLILLILNR